MGEVEGQDSGGGGRACSVYMFNERRAGSGCQINNRNV